MAESHFVEDYERLVAQLIEKYPIDEAMSLAVGCAVIMRSARSRRI
jgi:hypothetical protein